MYVYNYVYVHGKRVREREREQWIGCQSFVRNTRKQWWKDEKESKGKDEGFSSRWRWRWGLVTRNRCVFFLSFSSSDVCLLEMQYSREWQFWQDARQILPSLSLLDFYKILWVDSIRFVLHKLLIVDRAYYGVLWLPVVVVVVVGMRVQTRGFEEEGFSSLCRLALSLSLSLDGCCVVSCSAASCCCLSLLFDAGTQVLFTWVWHWNPRLLQQVLHLMCEQSFFAWFPQSWQLITPPLLLIIRNPDLGDWSSSPMLNPVPRLGPTASPPADA